MMIGGTWVMPVADCCGDGAGVSGGVRKLWCLSFVPTGIR